MRILVAGAGGFIGGHLVWELMKRGHVVIAVSSRPVDKWIQRHPVINLSFDLRDPEACDYVTSLGVERVFNLAAKVGGIGYIESHRFDCALSSLINTNLLRASIRNGVERYFFASSACVYPSMEGLICEHDAYPANPSEGYGWEKIFSEKMCQYSHESGLIKTRVARYFTTYGPGDDIKGAEDKDHVPAALCRKIIAAEPNGTIDVWGTGREKRNFLHVRDAVEGTLRLMDADYHLPVNLGSDEQVSIIELIGLIEKAAGKRVAVQYTMGAKGVHARNSDNSLIRQVLGWEPQIKLDKGIPELYEDLKKKIVVK